MFVMSIYVYAEHWSWRETVMNKLVYVPNPNVLEVTTREQYCIASTRKISDLWFGGKLIYTTDYQALKIQVIAVDE